MKIPRSAIEPFGTLITPRTLAMSMIGAHIHNEMRKFAELAEVQPISSIPWGRSYTMEIRYEDEDS